MINYIILHGSFGQKDSNWFAWLRAEIEKTGNKCQHEQFPIGPYQNYRNWAKAMDEFKVDEETIVIAHSAAPIFVVRYLLQTGKRIAKLVSVAGFNSKIGHKDFDKVNETFLMNNIEGFEKHCAKRICIYSDDDPYVKFELSDKFADEINARKVVIKGGKHFNEESGYTQFPELLRECYYKLEEI